MIFNTNIQWSVYDIIKNYMKLIINENNENLNDQEINNIYLIILLNKMTIFFER